MIGDAAQHMAQVRLGVEVVELRGPNERVHRGRVFAAAIGASE